MGIGEFGKNGELGESGKLGTESGAEHRARFLREEGERLCEICVFRDRKVKGGRTYYYKIQADNGAFSSVKNTAHILKY